MIPFVMKTLKSQKKLSDGDKFRFQIIYVAYEFMSKYDMSFIITTKDKNEVSWKHSLFTLLKQR